MDFQNLVQNTKDFFSNLWAKVTEYVKENKLLSACIGALVLVILIAVGILCSALKKPETKTYERPLTLTEEMLIPPGPAVPDGYNPSRVTKEAWTTQEADVWFTKPGPKELEDLSKANDRMVEEITGAAP